MTQGFKTATVRTQGALFAASLAMLAAPRAASAAPPEEDEAAPETGENATAAAPAPAETTGDAAAREPEPKPEPAPEPDTDDRPVPAPEPTSVGGAVSADAGASAKPEQEPETFGVPEREGPLMSDHPVNVGKMKYRPGKGLEIKSEDEMFGLQLRLRAQMLYSLENEKGADPETVHSFQIRRARLAFAANFFGEHNKMKTEFALAPRDIGLDRGDGTIARSPLLDWYFEFDHLKSLTLRVGQYKIPFSRQRVISSGDLQLVDRSIANGEFNLDRDIGFDIRSKDFLGMGWLRYYLGIYTGEGHSSFELYDFGMNYLARVEVLPFGQFDDYSEVDFDRFTTPKLSIGAAYAFIDNAHRDLGVLGRTPADGGTSDYHNATADFIFKLAGWSVQFEGFLRQGTRNPGRIFDEDGNPILDEDGNPIVVEDPRNGIGYMVQTGFLFPKTSLELAGRFSEIRPLGTQTSVSRRSEAGGGLSYYFAHHPFKVQADYFRHYAQGDVSDGSHVFRVQLQGAF